MYVTPFSLSFIKDIQSMRYRSCTSNVTVV
jgi:hypothetical protein